MVDYMMRLVEERRKAPGEDVASRFIEAEDGDTERAGEAAMQCFQMVAAGFVTSVNQIANTVLALLDHPAELAKLREAPGLVRGAVEESLRFGRDNVQPAALSSSSASDRGEFDKPQPQGRNPCPESRLTPPLRTRIWKNSEEEHAPLAEIEGDPCSDSSRSHGVGMQLRRGRVLS
ncbi:hypothetical protein [Sorangium sp. So ce124]|uniref:hypothetical protein n=1 Tax=Sorangium sp. So ce124 TaxID=3133280 RepID=UPI003F6075DF